MQPAATFGYFKEYGCKLQLCDCGGITVANTYTGVILEKSKINSAELKGNGILPALINGIISRCPFEWASFL